MNTLVNNLAVSELPSLLTIENGEKVSATFSLSEYQNRQSKLRQLMEELEIDHVLFSSIHNINYYADFIYCSFGRFYGLVVSPEKVVTISANIDAGQPWRRTVGDYNVVYTDWQRDNYFKAVTQEIPNKGRVGIEFDHLPLERLNKLKAVLPNVEFIDISKLLVTFIDRDGWEDFSAYYSDMKPSHIVFKSDDPEEDLFDLIIQAIKTASSNGRIPFLIRSGCLYGTGIENVNIMEHRDVMSLQHPLVIFYPSAISEDNIHFLNFKPASKYRCTLVM